MKTVGLITEYNPFHLGHKYHISEAKRITGADKCIVVMSGNYVQRGAASFADKYTKTMVALNGGADIIIELPYCFACSSAEYFAYSAVTILDRLNITDFLCFGAEHDDIKLLYSIGEILVNEPASFKERLKTYLKTGLSFPSAREHALKDYLSSTSPNINTAYLESVLSSPNNILGIEYIKAVIKRKSNIKPVALKRINAGYHEKDSDKRFYSATAIRENNNIRETLGEIDKSYLDTYQKTYPLEADDFSTILGSSLINHINNNTLCNIWGITDTLENKIKNSIYEYTDFTSFIKLLKTKDLSYTNIARCLLHCMLNTEKSQMKTYMDNNICDFIKVLGFRKESADILKRISESSHMSILTKLSDKDKILNNIGEHNKTLLYNWIVADDLYRMTAVNKYKYISKNEYTSKLITLP